MKKIVILRGIPNSGKTTFRNRQLRFVVFNTDNTVTACSVDSIEKEVFKK